MGGFFPRALATFGGSCREQRCSMTHTLRLLCKEVLALRCIFSLVYKITNTKFSNCPNAFKIGVVWQLNMYSGQQNTFQSYSPFIIK